MIKTVKGNLLSVTEGIILHGVNCQGVMGSGIALQIRNKYPVVYHNYTSLFNKLKEQKIDKATLLGSIQEVIINKDLSIINCFTQLYYGRDPKVRYIDYVALERCLELVIQLFNTKKLTNSDFKPLIAFPRIGAGLANGDWSVIENIIEKTLGKYSHAVSLELYDIKQ